MNKLFRSFSTSFSLPPLPTLQALAPLLWVRGGQSDWTAAELGLPAGCAGEAGCLRGAQRSRAALQRGLVFRQSDRSQPEYPENPRNQQSTHISPPSQHLHPPSLSTCLFCEAFLVCVSSSFPAWNLFPDSSPLFRSPPRPPPRYPFNSALSYSLMFLSLCLPSLLLSRFNKRPGGRREKTGGGVKTSMALFTKGPGIARR